MVTFLMIISMLVAVFLIMLVLVQRGKGGGLAGALGGMGGQSAFGTKAGDLFTRVTIVAAAVWILCCVVVIKKLNMDAAKDPTANAGFGSNASTEKTPLGVPPLAPGRRPGGATTPITPDDGSNEEGNSSEAPPGTGVEPGSSPEAPKADTPAGDSPASDAPTGDKPAEDAPAESP